jgi:hypothetical protein
MSNRPALLSLVAALLTITFFCIGFMPFLPLTAIVCYPAAFISALFAIVSGLRGLKYPLARWMAWVGIVTGLAVILAVTLFTSLTLLLLPAVAEGVVEIWQSLWP